ncbi:hypothetical protein AMJ48_03055 [Parcubacteria bacterium DG_74_1]|nr:MAG: hypothetical protein AMJ48_03055 [Parcubacteria bacterium DG_74_1]
MNFSYNWLQSFFKKKLPKPEKLAELLTMHSFEVAEVKKFNRDWILDIDILPNRGPDSFSCLGIAREISTLAGFKYIADKYELKEDKGIKARDFINVEVRDKTACSRYTARVITEVKVGFSPKWMRERLEACGLKPINNIVDVANYVMLETGQPLHAFDGEKLQDRKIIVRFAKEGEKIITLDEERYRLEKEMLVITDAKKPVAIAGIKGGKPPEIDLKTKIVVLESANFNPRVIRRASKRIDLKTDASWRFEHGIDPNLTEFAINRATLLIQEIAGGRIAQGLIDFYPGKVFPKRVKLDLDYVTSLLGIKISHQEIIAILKSLGFKIKHLKSKIIEVEVPTFRLDVSIPEDLIEEIGRIHGYQEIPAQFPVAALIPPKRNLDIFWENLSGGILKEAGFTEAYNYSFISEKDREIFRYSKRELMEVENPTSLDFQYLRPSLIPNLLKNIEKNFRDFAEIKIFELGKIFHHPKTEKKVLSGVMSGEVFYETKGTIDLLLNKLGVSNIWFDEYRPKPGENKLSIWQPKKCAEIKINHEKIGFLGEISPKILDSLKVAIKVSAFDIDFEKLSKLTSEEHEYRPISRFPSAVRDIAILVPREVKVAQVLNKIYDTGKKLVRDVDLFDIYEGGELPAGKKNLAFHIIYQAEDRTMTSEEIDGLQKKIISALEKNRTWQVRQ